MGGMCIIAGEGNNEVGGRVRIALVRGTTTENNMTSKIS